MTEFMRTKHGGTKLEWRRRCRTIAADLAAYVSNESPDIFVVWNGQDHVGRIISHLARQKGIPVAYMENGYFPDTLQMDSKGVNSAASLAEKSFDELVNEAPVRLAEVPAAVVVRDLIPISTSDQIKLYIDRAMLINYYATYPEQRGSDKFKKRKLQKLREQIPEDVVEIPEKFVFIPLQVHDDTQVLLNCRHFNSVESFFEAAYPAIKRNFGSDFKIVVKEHPEDLGRWDYTEFRKKFPDVIWLRKYNVEKLLDKASCVVLINSSVGLQAIKRMKPTVVFGESFYSKPEVSFYVRDLAVVDDVMKAAASGITPAMQANIEFFLGYLSSVFFLPGAWKT